MKKETKNVKRVNKQAMSFIKIKIRKDTIIAFVIGIILASSVAVYATVTASGVTYTTAKNENIKNVGEALNDLYAKTNNNHEIGMWLGWNGYIIESMITKEDDTYEIGRGAGSILGNKIKIENYNNNADTVKIYALKKGKFKITVVNNYGTQATVEEKEFQAGDLISECDSVTYGIIEALF